MISAYAYTWHIYNKKVDLLITCTLKCFVSLICSCCFFFAIILAFLCLYLMFSWHKLCDVNILFTMQAHVLIFVLSFLINHHLFIFFIWCCEFEAAHYIILQLKVIQVRVSFLNNIQQNKIFERLFTINNCQCMGEVYTYILYREANTVIWDVKQIGMYKYSDQLPNTNIMIYIVCTQARHNPVQIGKMWSHAYNARLWLFHFCWSTSTSTSTCF